MTDASGLQPAYTLRLQPDYEALSYVRLVLRRTLPRLDETSDALFYGAVTEIVSNAIAAQSEADPGEPVQVRVQIVQPTLIQIVDRGAGFDPEKLNGAARHGFGLHIVRSVVPDLVIESSDRGTVVTLPYPVDQ